jgi:hypothetical protein
MAIRIRDTSTREDVKLAIQNAVRQQVQTFDALSNVEHELGFGLINLDSIVQHSRKRRGRRVRIIRGRLSQHSSRIGTRVSSKTMGQFHEFLPAQREKRGSMKTDSESVLQLNSSEFEVILAALHSFQNQNRGRETNNVHNDSPDYTQGIDPIAPGIQHLIARISCPPESHNPDPGK